jgi:Dolichyl-phosphate-mannose-protein mannosyltransferase
MPQDLARSRSRDYAILAVLCVVCASVNLTKAVHVDDTFHLGVVDAILRDPLHVMSASVNWYDAAQPIGGTNQPHLFFYLQALVTVVFGRSALAQHLLMAGIASVAVLLFYRLAALVAPRSPLVLTTLFALGPAFLPGQDLMVDVPLVALWLLFFWAILSRGPSGMARYGVAALAVAAACLVKYTSLVLIVVLVATIVRRRQWSALAWLGIPVAALAGWSILNVIDYGRIHVLDRHGAPLRVRPLAFRSLDWIVGIGAVAPFAVAWWARLSPGRTRRAILLAAACGAVVMFAGLRLRGTPAGEAAWWALFLGNGLLTLGLAGRGALSDARTDQAQPDDRRAILWWWLGAVSLFIVVFTPFMAVRHVLLVMPAILLLLGSDRDLALDRWHAAAAVALTALLGVGLALSDYIEANVYRVQAPLIRASLPAHARVWCVGHWGWQWYASRAGMEVYDLKTSVLQAGDYLVMPALPDQQEIPAWRVASLRKVRQIAVPAGPLSWLRTMSITPHGGYYAFSLHAGTGPPWLVSTQPLDSFAIYRVTD